MHTIESFQALLCSGNGSVFLHTLKTLQVLHSDSCICTFNQFYWYVVPIIPFNISHLMTHSWSIKQIYLTHRWDPNQVFEVTVDMGEMAMKWYYTFPKALLLNLTLRWLLVITGHSLVEFLPLCGDAVIVFYGPIRQGFGSYNYVCVSLCLSSLFWGKIMYYVKWTR